MTETSVAVGLGSNVGKSRRILTEAGRRLRNLGPIRLSRFYISAPLHILDQPDYLNQVAVITTRHPPSEILHYLHEIEQEWGRNRSTEHRFGARSLDLDLLLWGNLIIQGPRLTIPHPRMTQRAFVLLPLLELDPLGRNPVTDIPWKESLSKIKEQVLVPLSP